MGTSFVSMNDIPISRYGMIMPLSIGPSGSVVEHPAVAPEVPGSIPGSATCF